MTRGPASSDTCRARVARAAVAALSGNSFGLGRGKQIQRTRRGLTKPRRPIFERRIANGCRAYSPRRLSSTLTGTAVQPCGQDRPLPIRGRGMCPPPPEIDNQASDTRAPDDADPRRSSNWRHDKEPSETTDPRTRHTIPVRSGPTEPYRWPLDDRLTRGQPGTWLVHAADPAPEQRFAGKPRGRSPVR